jgi:hypothetical protein
LLALTLFLTGCFSAGPPKLVFRSVDSAKMYTQQFQRAYYSKTNDGEYDIVLVEDGITQADSKSNGPLISSPTIPLSQIVHIRILWKAPSGSKPDTPSATNAIIDWYVRASDSPDRLDRLHYRGAGFVIVYESTGTSIFDVRSSQLSLSESKGRLQDPLGTTSVLGSFTATLNDGMVASTLESLNDEPGRMPPSQSSVYQGAPPRSPYGP